MNETNRDNIIELMNENASLRAECAALRKILLEAREWIDFGGHHTSEEECYVCERLARIDAALRGGEKNG